MSLLRPMKNWMNSMLQEEHSPASSERYQRGRRHSSAAKKPTGRKMPILAMTRNSTQPPYRPRRISLKGISWRVFRWRSRSTGGNRGRSPRAAATQRSTLQKLAGKRVRAARPAQNNVKSRRACSRDGGLYRPIRASRRYRWGLTQDQMGKARHIQGSI